MLEFLGRVLVEIIRWPVVLGWYAFGWRMESRFPNIDKYVVLGVPHTTNWDYFFMLIMALHERRYPYVTAKHTLFKPPFGWFVRAVGGISINRSLSQNVVDQIAERIRNTDRMMMVFTPEGTRSYRDRWKTGFYWTAHAAGVPIVCGYIDYVRKRCGSGLVLYPTGDIEADFEKIKAYYEVWGRGKYPEKTNALRVEVQRPNGEAEESVSDAAKS